MIKIFYIGFMALILFLAKPFLNTSDKIKVVQDYPSIIQPGSEFIVTLTIHKSDIKGFARMQQYLPAGFTASELQNNNARFTFEENSVKFVWLNLPRENDFTISYKIKTDKNITGKNSINGVFVFIENEQTQRVSLPVMEINSSLNAPENASVPQVTRQLLSIHADNGEYKVVLTFHPNNVTESAQFKDEIPAEYTAELIDAHGAAFGFENQSAIFNWEKLPADTSFVISYFVRSGKKGLPPVINGILLYGDENIAAGQTLLKEDADFVATSNEKPEIQNDKSVITPDVPMADISLNLPDVKNFPVPEKGIIFKVQISATQRSPIRNNNWFSYNYKLESPVELTNHEGWNKYLIGSFQAYNDASEFRNKTREKISDAFVVAFNNGVRIPVRDALNDKPLNQ